MTWNKDYKKQGNWLKKDKPVYKPKRGPLKPLMTEEEKSSAKVEELAYDFACRILVCSNGEWRDLGNSGIRE